MTPGRSADAVRDLLPGASVEGVERQVSTDQANLSVAVDERWLVKWFSRPVGHRDVQVLEHLSARGFAHMPTHVGVVAEDDAVVAIVSELVPGATDGWVWFVDDVLAWLDRGDGVEALIATAAQMGAIAAQLHLALADADDGERPLEGIRATVAERRHIALDETEGEPGRRLRSRSGRIDGALASLASRSTAWMQRVHGDLHAGQFLRSDRDRSRLLLTDFDGDPMTASAARLPVQPVERDLAGLLQSIDHVGRVAAKRRSGADVTPFVEPAIDAALGAYRALRPYDEALLWPLRVAQELHEYAYAARHLPVWGYVPDAAMCALFPEEDPA